jgi:hypothetical protein
MSNPSPKSNRKVIIAVVAAAVVILLCCCIIAVVVVVVDPFNLDLIGRLSGKKDAAAQAMPVDTGIYMGINMLNTTPEKIERIIAPFRSILEQEGVQAETTQSLQEQFDQEVLKDMGMTIADDIIPWIGQYAGFGISDIVIGDYGDLQSAQFIFAVEARDNKAADAFLDKLATGIEDSSGYAFVQQTYGGATIYVLDTDYEDEKIVFTRAERVLLFSQDELLIQDAIDAQKGDSLFDQPGYTATVKQLPGDRSLTMYFTSDQYESIFSSILASAAPSSTFDAQSILAWKEMAASLSIVDAGLKLDSIVTYDPATLSDTQKQMMQSTGTASKTAGMFPDDTVLFVTGQHLDLVWKSIREMMDSMGTAGDFDESMNIFEEQFNFNLDSDLLSYLDGEYALGVVPSTQGLLAEQLNVQIGIGIAAGTSNPTAVQETMDKLSDGIQNMGTPVETVDIGGSSFYAIGDPMMETNLLLFGTNQDFLLLGTDNSTLEAFVGEVPALSDNTKYKDTWKAFSSGMNPTFYGDVEGLIGVIREGLQAFDLESFDEAVKFLGPIPTVATAASPVKNNTAHSTLIIFITPVK